MGKGSFSPLERDYTSFISDQVTETGSEKKSLSYNTAVKEKHLVVLGRVSVEKVSKKEKTI